MSQLDQVWDEHLETDMYSRFFCAHAFILIAIVICFFFFFHLLPLGVTTAEHFSPFHQLFICLFVLMFPVMCDIAFVNNTAIVCQNPKVTAINSCIEVDLTGQVVSDSIGTRMYSGRFAPSWNSVQLE